MIEVALMALAGLVVGGAANWAVERLPVQILEDEARSADPPAPYVEPAWVRGRWRQVRRIVLSVATGGLFALAVVQFEADWVRVASSAVFAAAFLTLGIIDLEHQLLPDKIVLPGIAVGVAFSLFLGHLDPWEGALGALAGFALFLPIWGWAQLTGRAGQIMGFGDLKFSAMMGAALGLQFWGVAVYAGVLLGGLAAVLLMAGRIILPGPLGRLKLLPYGTFLAVGALAALYFGRPIVDWAIDLLA